MSLSRLVDLLPSRLTIAAVLGCIVFAALSIWLGWTAGVAEHDRRQAQAQADSLDGQINDPTTGYVARLTQCRSGIADATASLDRQSRAIETLRAAGQAAAERAARQVQAAQAQAGAAERRAQAVLQAQLREGEAPCEAAFRLHQETIE